MSALSAQRLATGTRSGVLSEQPKWLPTSRADIAIRQSEGEGAPILLVHAIGHTSKDFDELFGYALARDHRLIAADLPGHGRSGDASDPDTAYTIEGYAETLLEMLERLGIDSAFVIDASHDGNIGKELMTIFPGMLGLAIVGGRSRGVVIESSGELAPIYRVGELSEEALEPVILSLELREAALSIAPRLWYGG